uniref:Uncharacterized protein n=2 Tax=Rhizophora mucronata TaxID=61149 RepID=A0A2P2J9Q7_RHIMU
MPPPPAGPFVYKAVNSLVNRTACSFNSNNPSMRSLISSIVASDEVLASMLVAFRLSSPIIYETIFLSTPGQTSSNHDLTKYSATLARFTHSCPP